MISLQHDAHTADFNVNHDIYANVSDFVDIGDDNNKVYM